MAYRKTEKVLAQLEARRAGIIASAIDVIAKSGMEGLTTDSVAARAGIAVGLIYHYFPDKTELVAAVVAHCLERDLAAIRKSSPITTNATARLEIGISVFARLMISGYDVKRDIARDPTYREGIRAEFAELIRATGATETPSVLSAVVFGAVYEYASIRPRVEQSLTTSLLRAVGVPSRRKAAAVAGV